MTDKKFKSKLKFPDFSFLEPLSSLFWSWEGDMLLFLLLGFTSVRVSFKNVAIPDMSSTASLFNSSPYLPRNIPDFLI